MRGFEERVVVDFTTCDMVLDHGGDLMISKLHLDFNVLLLYSYYSLQYKLVYNKGL